jgi:hypothetical protein
MPMEQRPPRSSASPSERRLTRPETVTSTPSSPSTLPPAQPRAASRAAAFAHASEAEFARILDFYGVRWEYEPHTFPILWNLDGGVAESFSPDFWLPDLELFVELTTLRQSLVRKKNRKLRRLRELYPGVRVKLFYGRDFRALMLKYGKLGLVEGLTGAPGQSTLVQPAGLAVDPLGEPVGVAVGPLVPGRSAPAGPSQPLAGPRQPLAGPSQPHAGPIPAGVPHDPTLLQASADEVARGQPAAGEAVPAAGAIDAIPPAPASSRSARRRRRRRVAAQLGRRAQLEEAASQPPGRHEPMTRR